MRENDRFEDSLSDGGTFVRWVRDRGEKICVADGPRLHGSGIEDAMDGKSCYLQFTITETGYKPGGDREGDVFVESVEFVPESDDRIPEADDPVEHSPENQTSRDVFEQGDDLKSGVNRRKQ